MPIFTSQNTGLDQASKLKRARRVGDLVLNAWRAEARDLGLKSTLGSYIQALQIKRVTASYVIVGMPAQGVPQRVATVAGIIENGFGPVDMRSFLLTTQRAGSSPIRYTKKERRPYRYISFRRSVAEIKNIGYRGAYGGQGGAKNLAATYTGPEGTLWGARLPPGHAPKLREHHASDFLAGLVRVVSAYATTSQASYKLFRTVSYKRPEAWQYPHKKGAFLARKIQEEIPEILGGIAL